MPEDRNVYAEHAKRCLELAAGTSDPLFKQNLEDAAQRWTQIAPELTATSEFLSNCEGGRIKV